MRYLLPGAFCALAVAGTTSAQETSRITITGSPTVADTFRIIPGFSSLESGEYGTCHSFCPAEVDVLPGDDPVDVATALAAAFNDGICNVTASAQENVVTVVVLSDEPFEYCLSSDEIFFNDGCPPFSLASDILLSGGTVNNVSNGTPCDENEATHTSGLQFTHAFAQPAPAAQPATALALVAGITAAAVFVLRRRTAHMD